ncbi:MAG: hypothetical protein Q8P02_01500 [Candidatus Micrarchaeota archaeon]|nr:hypothetical protein [Candidatus Micrarchaeota archaeon]
MMDKQSYSGNVSEEDLEDLFKEATHHGAILAEMYFDAHGPSKDGIQNSLIDFLNNLQKQPGVLYCKGEIEEALESRDEKALTDNMRFSCSTRVRILAENFSTLLGLCLRFGPLAVEIERPHTIELNLEEAQGLLLDASSTTQDYVAYIMSKTMKEDERAKLQEHLKKRAEIAQKIKEKHDHAAIR